jgi:hypothetical protein
MPTPTISFNGMDFNLNGAGHPPDPVGDVGPNHFIQAVNTSIGIFNKTTGAPISTFTFNSLWSGAATGTPCDTSHRGDPTVIYSKQNDRFIVADFSWTSLQNGPYYECIAVSKTSNPVTGGWWLYAFRADDATHPWLPDYPKMGIWPDGLYMTANMFDCLNSSCSSATYKEVRVYAFNIVDLVNGAVLRSVVADTSSSRFSLLPSNYRGTPPPAGTPNYVAGESIASFSWEVFKFQVDYATPANSTFTGPTNVSQASYVLAADPVPEPAPGNNTDTLADRAMMQAQYRNIAGVESLWVNHTTGTPSASTPTGIQWAQINVTGGTVNTTPVQQQIFNNAADGLNRFMGALAVDNAGNIALGYTASSSAVAPDIRYAGRLSTDALNQLPQSETTMLPSVTRSVQTGNCGPGPCTRWGDYSAMTVDPVDECTFWYTNMYFPVEGLNWVTRIGSFKFPTCTCMFTLDRDHQSFAANGGNGTVNVTASDATCDWTASTTSTFITITSGSSGTGNGTVQYSVAVNAGSTIRNNTITIAGQTFTVYQGINFLDVPSNDPFYTDIGKLAARNVTVGCGSGNYCPNDLVTREQMAAFILRAKGEFNPPPPASQRFDDVPPGNPFYNLIDRLAALGITVGCQASPPLYCPSNPVKREQMSAFIMRGLGVFNLPTPSTQRFDDVPPINQFYNFIDRLAVLQITLGCSAAPPLYCPTSDVTRAQMAAFLVRAFNL